MLTDLPAPKTVTQSDRKQDDYLEDAVKAKPSQIADAPKPPSKTRKPVKISIPTIDSVRLFHYNIFQLKFVIHVISMMVKGKGL